IDIARRLQRHHLIRRMETADMLVRQPVAWPDKNFPKRCGLCHEPSPVFPNGKNTSGSGAEPRRPPPLLGSHLAIAPLLGMCQRRLAHPCAIVPCRFAVADTVPRHRALPLDHAPELVPVDGSVVIAALFLVPL